MPDHLEPELQCSAVCCMSGEFDVVITLSDAALGGVAARAWPLSPRSSPSDPTGEFDLEIKYLDFGRVQSDAGPPNQEIAAGSGWFAITCSPACAAPTRLRTCAPEMCVGPTVVTCSPTCAPQLCLGQTLQTCVGHATCAPEMCVGPTVVTCSPTCAPQPCLGQTLQTCVGHATCAPEMCVRSTELTCSPTCTPVCTAKTILQCA